MDNPDSMEQQIQILKNIERLQTIEKELYKELEGSGTGTGTSAGSGSNADITWTRLGQQYSYFTVPPNTRVRYGVPGRWIESVKSGGFIGEPSTMGGDPAPGLLKYIESASTSNANVAPVNTANIDSIINRINQLSQVRISLYKTLNTSYKSLQRNVNSTRTELVELITVVSIVEEELNNAKKQLNQLNEIKNNKTRMVQINTYYGKQYKAQAGLTKLCIFVGVLLLILAILRKKSLIPEVISNILLGIVFALGGFFIIRRTLDIFRRDNMNFDAYDWQFNPDTQIPTVYDYNVDKLSGLISDAKNMTMPSGFNGIDCIGNACCTAGMNYDATQRKCIKNVAPETFVSGQLTKHCFNGKPTIQKNSSDPNYPAPYGDGDSINFATF